MKPMFMEIALFTFWLGSMSVLLACPSEDLIIAHLACPKISICDIGNITFHLTMAKYLPMLPKGETETTDSKQKNYICHGTKS